jgi:hypothetical protein
MKKIILMILIFAVYGCSSTHYYWPTTQNVPLFKEKNELMASFGYYNFDRVKDFRYEDGFCFHTAYSITDHIACQFGYNTKMEIFDIDYAEVGEVGIAYYLRHKDYLAFETFGGYSYGKIVADNDYYKSIANFNRIYLQPSIGICSDHIDIAFTPRFSKVDYHIKEYITYFPSPYDEINNNIDKNSYYFFEPGITVRLGFKYVKFQFQHIEVKKLNKDGLIFFPTSNSFSILFYMPIKKKMSKWRRDF